jgi:hypothetical protein
MTAQVFLSYSSKDQKVAQTICAALENRGLNCWISSRDVGPGQNFQEAIVKAIRAACGSEKQSSIAARIAAERSERVVPISSGAPAPPLPGLKMPAAFATLATKSVAAHSTCHLRMIRFHNPRSCAWLLNRVATRLQTLERSREQWSAF